MWLAIQLCCVCENVRLTVEHLSVAHRYKVEMEKGNISTCYKNHNIAVVSWRE